MFENIHNKTEKTTCLDLFETNGKYGLVLRSDLFPNSKYIFYNKIDKNEFKDFSNKLLGMCEHAVKNWEFNLIKKAIVNDVINEMPSFKIKKSTEKFERNISEKTYNFEIALKDAQELHEQYPRMTEGEIYRCLSDYTDI